MLITLPSHMLTLKPSYTILHKLYIVFNIMYLSHRFKKKKSTLDEEWQHFYQQPLWSSTPNSHFDTLSPRRRWQQCVCVCVFADVRVPFQYVFMLVFEEGEAFQGTNVDAAGRLRTTDTHTQHHPEPPPPPPCGVAIIKMIYLTIGPRLRD